jgi:hypothetical protein
MGKSNVWTPNESLLTWKPTVKRQKLLKRLDRIVHSLECVTDIVHALDLVIAGVRLERWVLESDVFKRSRLLQRYYYLSMDLTV